MASFVLVIGTSFQRVIPDSGPASVSPEKVRKLLLCTGKIYYELLKVRRRFTDRLYYKLTECIFIRNVVNVV